MEASSGSSIRISRRKLLQRLGIVGAGAGAVGLGVGYGIGSAGEDAPDDAASAGSSGGAFKIGGSLPLTGPFAADGQEQRQALTLAIEEWNDRGGVLGRKIELVTQDVVDMSPERIISTFRELVNRETVDVIINGYLLFSGPEFDIVAGADPPIPYFHVNTQQASVDKYKGNRDKYWMIFQNDSPDTFYGKAFPIFLKAIEGEGRIKPRDRSVAIVFANDPYNTTIAENLRQALPKVGWKATLSEQVVAPVRDWGPVLSKIRSANPDVVFLSDLNLSDAGSFTKQFVQNPTQSLLYSQYVPSLPAYLELAGAAANGVTWATLAGLAPTAEGESFRAAYAERWGAPPGFTIGGLLYDMTNWYLTAVSQTGDVGDRRQIVKTLEDGSWSGSMNITRFNDDHFTPAYPAVIDRPDGQLYTIFQIQDGKQLRVYPSPFTDAEYKQPPWIS